MADKKPTYHGPRPLTKQAQALEPMAVRIIGAASDAIRECANSVGIPASTSLGYLQWTWNEAMLGEYPTLMEEAT